MKQFLLAFSVTAMLVACQSEPPRIVSDQTVDDVIMGAELCQSVSEPTVIRSFEQAGMQDVHARNFTYGSSNHLMVFPSSDDGLVFGGCRWDYADYCKDPSGDLYAVVFENFFKSRKQALEQYKNVTRLVGGKHGKANFIRSKASCTSMWTDDTNSVGVSVHKDLSNEDKWTCTFYYVNIALYHSL